MSVFAVALSDSYELMVVLFVKPSGAQPERIDGEYTREGTAAIFMAREPLAGLHHVFARAQHKRVDFTAVQPDVLP